MNEAHGFGILIAGWVGFWWLFQSSFSEIKSDIKAIKESLANYKVEVVKDYVSKEDCKECRHVDVASAEIRREA